MAPENSAEERERGEDLYKWARRCENEPQVMGSMKMLEGLTVESADMFDQNDWLLNFPNGTLDLASGDFRECRKEDYITKTIPFEYDDLIRATCPQWMQFLSEVFPGKYARLFPICNAPWVTA